MTNPLKHDYHCNTLTEIFRAFLLPKWTFLKDNVGTFVPKLDVELSLNMKSWKTLSNFQRAPNTKPIFFFHHKLKGMSLLFLLIFWLWFVIVLKRVYCSRYITFLEENKSLKKSKVFLYIDVKYPIVSYVAKIDMLKIQ